MNLQSYIKALKQPDEKVYAEAEAKLLAMKESAIPLLQQALNPLIQKSKLRNTLGCATLLATAVVLWRLPFAWESGWNFAGVVVGVWVTGAIIDSMLSERVISSQYSKQETIVATPRLIATIAQLDTEGQVPLLFDIHKWTYSLQQYTKQKYIDTYRENPFMKAILSSFRNMESEQYYRLPPQYRGYILCLLKEHTAFMCGRQGPRYSPSRSSDDGPTGLPYSDYDLKISRAILELYARVGETSRSSYIMKIANTSFANHLVTARIVKNYAEAVLARLDAVEPRDMTLLRPAERPPNYEDLLTPIFTEEETQLLRASDKPPEK
ncbi:MAG: hypothetical protein NT023_21885 [Armatimonadetes bacterium]|nr:hypothetical protein [Armatimonadota bacterium]